MDEEVKLRDKKQQDSVISAVVNSRGYYSEWSGHPLDDLRIVYDGLKRQHSRSIFLAGDSSLDNKYWFAENFPAVNGYELVLRPPNMKADVCYWVNKEIVDRKEEDLFCLNTAVEATSLNSRVPSLLDQDKFIRDNITSEDYLVVSVGGNDIALQPLLCTIINMATMVCCTPMCCLENCAAECVPNSHIDAGCYCCGLPGCITGLLSWPFGLGYFVDMFKHRVRNYVARLVARTKPKKVIVCMIYFPDEDSSSDSWANASLGCLGYSSNPRKLQLLIRKMFLMATSNIKIKGTEIVPLPLFEVLNPKDTCDYVQRVEPSPQGGSKMGKAILDAVLKSS